MIDRRAGLVIGIIVALVLIALIGIEFGALSALVDVNGEATVTIYDETGAELGVVHARVADTPTERFIGLSDTDTLASNEGMLFVFSTESDRTFVMRDMDFPIDMIFIGADGRITTIHEASHDDRPPYTRYRGEAQWVLEVRYGYAAAHDITVGDRVEINDSAR